MTDEIMNYYVGCTYEVSVHPAFGEPRTRNVYVFRKTYDDRGDLTAIFGEVEMGKNIDGYTLKHTTTEGWHA